MNAPEFCWTNNQKQINFDSRRRLLQSLEIPKPKQRPNESDRNGHVWFGNSSKSYSPLHLHKTDMFVVSVTQKN
jgi:hypothetical protein